MAKENACPSFMNVPKNKTAAICEKEKSISLSWNYFGPVMLETDKENFKTLKSFLHFLFSWIGLH